MNDAFLCDGIRTPIGRYAGALSGVRTDDLAALPLRELVKRNPSVDWAAVERLSRYGGIRIEDDVACRAGGEGPENLTRDAFAAVAG